MGKILDIYGRADISNYKAYPKIRSNPPITASSINALEPSERNFLGFSSPSNIKCMSNKPTSLKTIKAIANGRKGTDLNMYAANATIELKIISSSSFLFSR